MAATFVTFGAERGCFAGRDVRPGNFDETLVQRPWYAISNARLRDTCDYCHHTETPFEDVLMHYDQKDSSYTKRYLSPCADCGVLRYCSDVCAASARNEYHRSECKIYQKASKTMLSIHKRAVIRILVNLNNDDLVSSTWLATSAMNAYETKAEATSTERWTSICQDAIDLKELTETDYTTYCLQRLLLKLDIEGTPLMSSTYENIGIMLILANTYFNHNCEPNVVISSRGSYTRWTAIQHIKKGEELTISYLSGEMPTRWRQHILREKYFFQCDCARCLQEEEGEDFPVSYLDPTVLMPPSRRVTELLEASELDTTMSGKIQNLRYALFCIHQTNRWGLDWHPVPTILRKLVLAYTGQGQANYAFATTALLYFDVTLELYQEPLHPQRLFDLWLLVKTLGIAIETDDWASQKLNLTQYGLNFTWWRLYLLKSLVDTDATYWQKMRYDARKVFKHYWMIPSMRKLNVEKTQNMPAMRAMLDDTIQRQKVW